MGILQEAGVFFSGVFASIIAWLFISITLKPKVIVKSTRLWKKDADTCTVLLSLYNPSFFSVTNITVEASVTVLDHEGRGYGTQRELATVPFLKRRDGRGVQFDFKLNPNDTTRFSKLSNVYAILTYSNALNGAAFIKTQRIGFPQDDIDRIEPANNAQK